jgi:type IV secretion system protein VirB8
MIRLGLPGRKPDSGLASGQTEGGTSPSTRADGPALGTWSDDTIEALQRSRRIAWMVAGGAGAIAVTQALAIAFMMPLKQPVPYTITVDRDTGQVQTARGVDLGPLSESEAVTQAFLVQYVLARETFDRTDYRENFRKVLLWSKDDAESGYRREWDRSTPGGAFDRYSADTLVKVTVKSVTGIGQGRALVRFDTERSEGAGAGARNAYVAAIAFSFSGAPLSAQDRYLNPLGFQVSEYRRDSELVAPVPARPQSEASAAGSGYSGIPSGTAAYGPGDPVAATGPLPPTVVPTPDTASGQSSRSPSAAASGPASAAGPAGALGTMLQMPPMSQTPPPVSGNSPPSSMLPPDILGSSPEERP